MTRKLFKLYFRLIFSSAIIWVYYTVNLAFFMFIFYSVSVSGGFDSFYSVISSMGYVEMIIVCFAFCVAVVFAQRKQTLERICFVPAGKSSLVCALSVTVSVWPVVLIPVGFCLVMTAVGGTGMDFCLRVILYTCLRWVSFLSFFTALGFILGRCVRNAFAYLLSVPAAVLFSSFNGTILLRLLPDVPALEKPVTLLSIHHFPAGTMNVDYSAPNIDCFFLSKILSWVLLSAVLFCALYLACRSGRTLAGGLAAVLLTAAFGASAFSYMALFPQKADVSQGLCIPGTEEQAPGPYQIYACKGEVSLSERCGVDCVVGVRGGGEGIPLELKLDPAFEIEEILCGGASVPFERTWDGIVIDDTAITGSADFELEFKYSGRVYYCSSSWYMTAFSTKDSAGLPPGFAFLPMIPGDGAQREYSLKVRAKNPVVSNLDTEGGGGEYTLSGQSSLVCIFSGHFEQRTENGAELITAEGYNTVLPGPEELGDLKCYNLDLGYTHALGAAYPQKIFYISCFLKAGDAMGAPLYFDDCLILNHYA